MDVQASAMASPEVYVLQQPKHGSSLTHCKVWHGGIPGPLGGHYEIERHKVCLCFRQKQQRQLVHAR
jgi:hypothetical protein